MTIRATAHRRTAGKRIFNLLMYLLCYSIEIRYKFQCSKTNLGASRLISPYSIEEHAVVTAAFKNYFSTAQSPVERNQIRVAIAMRYRRKFSSSVCAARQEYPLRSSPQSSNGVRWPLDFCACDSLQILLILQSRIQQCCLA